MKGAIQCSFVAVIAALIPGASQNVGAEPITSVSGTASSFHAAAHVPDLAVNGAGLDPDTGLHLEDGTVRWTSAQFNGGTSLEDLVGAWLIADFGSVYELDHVDVWNYGSFPTARGYQAADVYVSTLPSPDSDFANVDEWTQVYDDEPLTQAPPFSGQFAATDSLDLTGHSARYVAFVVASTFDGTDGWVGLSELQFDGTPLQTPGTWRIDTSDSWNNPQNWVGSMVPDGDDESVTFGNVISSARTVFTETNVTANGIAFDSANEYAIAGNGTLTLDGDGTNASVSVLQGSHQFQSVVDLNVDADVDVAADASLAFNNVLNLNANTLTKTGDGTMTINNHLTTGGGSVEMSAGVLGGAGTINGNLVNNGGTLAPGNSPGTLTIHGDYTHSQGSLSIEIGGINRDSEYDSLDVSGVMMVNGGELLVTLLEGFHPSAGNVFDILDFGSADGVGFSSVSLPDLAKGIEWDTSQLLTAGTLSVVSSSVPEPKSVSLVALASVALLSFGSVRRCQVA